MKIYIALFTTLIAAGHFTNVSAADAAAPADGASHPHLRALADAAVDVAYCDVGYCHRDHHCGGSRVCTVNGGSYCSGVCVAEAEACANDYDCGRDVPFCTVDDERGNGVCCPRNRMCDSNGQGCPDGFSCDQTREVFTTLGCYECQRTPSGVGENEEVVAVQDEDEIEVSSLRASILKEE